MASEPGGLAGLLVDFGGVLTTDVFASFEAFCVAEGLAPGTVRDRFRDDPEARGLLADLETGSARGGAVRAALRRAPRASSPTGWSSGCSPAPWSDAAMVAAVRAAAARRRPDRAAVELLGRRAL